MRFLVDGRPGASLGFLLVHAAILVTLLDIAGHAFLLVGVDSICRREACVSP